jgi:hypothetical protein
MQTEKGSRNVGENLKEQVLTERSSEQTDNHTTVPLITLHISTKVTRSVLPLI